MPGISSAGSKLRLPLGQTPQLSNSAMQAEYQQVFNAVHILGQYLEVITEALGGTDTGTPAESLPFRKVFWATAAQAITAGSIVCAEPSGIVNGIKRNLAGKYGTPPVSSGAWRIKMRPNAILPGDNLTQQPYLIALTDAAPGALVKLGSGPGILALTGASCGQIVWGADFRILEKYGAYLNGGGGIERNPEIGYSGNGSMYLTNPSGGGMEGLTPDGYPRDKGDFAVDRRIFLYPVGIAIADGFVYLGSYVYG